ncbi:hypothetical protein HN011_004630, partial [Eciton burchellii]
EQLKGLEAMFDRHIDSMVLYDKFRSRKWRKDESFREYMHEKIILGNRVPKAEKEMLGFIIEGIPHWRLQTNIRVSGVSTKKELRARLENVVHWEKKNERDTGRYKMRLREQKNEPGTSGTNGGQEQGKRNCFNCGEANHISKDCPILIAERYPRADINAGWPSV